MLSGLRFGGAGFFRPPAFSLGFGASDSGCRGEAGGQAYSLNPKWEFPKIGDPNIVP